MARKISTDNAPMLGECDGNVCRIPDEPEVDINSCEHCGSQQCVSFRGADCPKSEPEPSYRWFKCRIRESGRVLYVRNGFGGDGKLCAVYDFERLPRGTGVRWTYQKCREKLDREERCDDTLNDMIEERFWFELNR